MVDLIVVNKSSDAAPMAEESQPSADRLLSGNYKTKCWNYYNSTDNRLFCGIWESPPGKVLCNYTEWEFCYIIYGKIILTNEEERSWVLKKGDAFIIPSGFKGTWETLKKVRKYYVILQPEADH